MIITQQTKRSLFSEQAVSDAIKSRKLKSDNIPTIKEEQIVVLSAPKDISNSFTSTQWVLTIEIPYTGEGEWFFVRPEQHLSFPGSFTGSIPLAVIKGQKLEVTIQQNIPPGVETNSNKTESEIRKLIFSINAYIDNLRDEASRIK